MMNGSSQDVCDGEVIQVLNVSDGMKGQDRADSCGSNIEQTRNIHVNCNQTSYFLCSEKDKVADVL